MSNYAKADTKAQWFQDNYPGSTLELSEDTTVVVLHTTEGFDWPGYEGGATAPNYTFKPGFAPQGGWWRAHFPDERSSRALRNLSGGVETNTLNAIQVELIGTCAPVNRNTWYGRKAGEDYVYWPEADDHQLRDIARFLVDMHQRHGLRLRAPKKFVAYPGSYGSHPERMTFAEWRNATGVVGHQHVPENSHGDPGALNVERILHFADRILKRKDS